MNLNPKENTQTQEKQKLVVGLEQFQVIAVNPTTDEINALYERDGKDDDKEQEYVTEREGNDQVRITFFLRALQSARITRKSFYIVDKERTNKDGNKHQYINQIGQTGWGASEDDLTDFFKTFTNKDRQVLGKKSFRIAKEGEGDFYEFAKSVLRGVNYYDPTTDITFDFKKMLKGNFKELNTVFTGDFASPFVATNYIKNVETENGMKTYNEVWTDVILAPEMLGKIEFAASKFYKETCEQIKEDEDEFKRLGINATIEVLTPQDIYGYVNVPDLKFKSEWDNKAWLKLKSTIEGEYGCKGFFKVSPLFEYNPNMDITAGNAPVANNDLSY